MNTLRARWWPGRLGLAVALLILVVGPLEAFVLSPSGHPWLQSLATTVAAAALVLRRVSPFATILVCFFVVGLNDEFTDNTGTFAGVFSAGFACISAGYELKRPAIYLTAPCIIAVPTAGLLFDFGSPVLVIDAIAISVLYGGAVLGGYSFRLRNEQAEQLRALAAELAMERDRRALEAVEAERARIARELHDIVSHSISLIVIQLQAVRRRLESSEPEAAADLRQVETVGRQAMAEMRRMLGVLRVQGGALELEPQPGLGQLPRLLEQTRAAGLPVALEVEGEAAPLPPGVDLAGYRIVQEALTNVLKHAGAASARVTLQHGDRELAVEVVDDGDGTAGPRDGGAGLAGMRERVTLYGGTFESGPVAPRGFRVAARLPVREEALRD